MLKLNVFAILTALSLVTPTLYAEDDMNMNSMSGQSMQNNTQQSTQMQQMQDEMKKLQEMHDKLMNAKTPEEKKTLLQAQMPMMQHGMEMMQTMGGTTNQEMMEKRMKMMQTMMQMMMDSQKMMMNHRMMGCQMMKDE
ncbi:type IV secretion protein Dot [Legionella sp. 227]|uniref:type IV secretion protein Dot n=1 Tax=Legionella sp. 227 TaxID=3367288 RepID=UPI00370DC2A3